MTSSHVAEPAEVDYAEGTPAGTTRVMNPAFSRPRSRNTVPGVPGGILRLAHVDVTVTDLDLATAYYTEVIGLLATERDEDSVYLKCWDEPNHHSLRLRYGPRVGMDQMSFRVERESDLDDFEIN